MQNQENKIHSINLYCPLTVRMDDPDYSEFVETDVDILGYYEDEIRDALEAELNRGTKEDMAAQSKSITTVPGDLPEYIVANDTIIQLNG